LRPGVDERNDEDVDDDDDDDEHVEDGGVDWPNTMPGND
jgi:hypothetical protein